MAAGQTAPGDVGGELRPRVARAHTRKEGHMSSNTFAFLYATRFWALVIGAGSMYLKAKGIIGEPEMLLIATITAGFTIVRTVDRATEQKILASAVESGQIPVSVL